MRTSFHHQPEAQHPKSSAINKLPADYPIFTAAPHSKQQPKGLTDTSSPTEWSMLRFSF